MCLNWENTGPTLHAMQETSAVVQPAREGGGRINIATALSQPLCKVGGSLSCHKQDFVYHKILN